jgi:hypothetical protein
MGYFPPDHGSHSNLAVDDHTIYHTDARGDARYPPKAGGAGASGSWPINVTGSAGSASSASSSTYANNANTIDGQTWNWSDIGLQTYFWASSDGNNVYVTWEGNWSRNTHDHSAKYSWLFGLAHVDVGTLAAATAYGPWTFGHSLQGNAPKMVTITGTYDDGANSILTSVGNLWDGTNVLITARNINGSENEACALCMIAWV